MRVPHLAATRAVATVALLAAAAAGAQPAPPEPRPEATPAARPDPLDPAVAVPPTTYRSAFTGYRPFADQPVGSWRAANDAVREAGGWRAYGREVAEGAAEAAAAAGAPAQPTR
jgi:hypothetical protein